MTEDAVRAAFETQARYCDELGSPFSAVLCRLLGERLRPGSRFGERILAWPGAPTRDALALRAMGSLHHLARSGAVPDLSAAYPPHATDPEALWAAVSKAIAAQDARLTAFLDSPPQTNEVGRSGALLGMLLRVSDTTGLPLNLLEIGASAGLNLDLDAFRYDLGEAGRWGDPASPVEVACAWSGAVPTRDAALRVASRAGCDRNPLDPASARDRERLLAYVWADQSARLARMEAALARAARRGWSVERADAADWLTARLRVLPEGCATVVYHTIVWQYLAEETKGRIASAIADASLRATTDAPLAWARMEPDAERDTAGLRLTLWPGGEERVLGRADFHGRFVRWT
jgi:hypothetical protein